MSPRSQEIRQSGLHGFLAQPDAPTKSGVMILATIFGLNAFVRGYAETLARAGLAAAVWDHYEGLPLITDQEESKQRSRSITDAAMHARVKAWIDHLEGELGLASIGVLGFCLGGRFAPLVAARDPRIKACAACYPSIEMPRHANQEQDAVAVAASVPCPALVIQPGHDHVATPETYAALKQNLFARSAPTAWQYYPEAHHGFMHRTEPAANAAATAVASPQLVAFLQGCLA
jgi:carboxymethylenebutenolidase